MDAIAWTLMGLALGQAPGGRYALPQDPTAGPPAAAGRYADLPPLGSAGSTPPAAGTNSADGFRSRVEPQQSAPQQDPLPPVAPPATTVQPSTTTVPSVRLPFSFSPAGETRDRAEAQLVGRQPKNIGSAEDLLAALLADTERLGLSPSRTPLAELLSSISDTSTRQQTILRYWELTAALADYARAVDHRARLSRLSAAKRQNDNEAADAVALAEAASAAQLHEAKFALREAQHALADTLGTREEILPADLPHAGVYHTRFDAVFASRRPPAEAWRIERTLPLRHEALDRRAEACSAQLQAFEQAAEGFEKRKLPIEDAIAAAVDVDTSLAAFNRVVREYNQDIGRYALLSAPHTAPNVLLSMLLKQPAGVTRPQPMPTTGPATQPRPATASTPNNPPITRGVRPATAIEPLDTQPQSPRSGVPQLAPYDPEADEAEADQPDGPPQSILNQPRTLQPGNAAPLRNPALPRTQTSNPSDGQLPPASIRIPLETEQGWQEVERRGQTAFKLQSSGWQSTGVHRLTEAVPAANDPGRYAELHDLSAPLRTQRLASLLHAAATATITHAQPLSLDDALATRRSEPRQLLTAYWRAAARAGEYVAAAQHAAHLSVLQEARGAASDPRLRAQRESAAAAEVEATARLREAQWWLSALAGMDLDQNWQVPASAPHGGRYLLRLDSLPSELSTSTPVRRTAAAVGTHYAALERHAAAVLAADEIRARQMQQYAAGRLTALDVVPHVIRQTKATNAYLQSLAEYNEAIGEYALHVLPSHLPVSEVSASLIVAR